MGCKLGIDPRQVENRSDLANQVIVGNGLFKTKRVKQPTLVVIEPPHHRPTPPRIVSERRNHCSREPSTTFATKSAKSGHRCYSIASSARPNPVRGTGTRRDCASRRSGLLVGLHYGQPRLRPGPGRGFSGFARPAPRFSSRPANARHHDLIVKSRACAFKFAPGSPQLLPGSIEFFMRQIHDLGHGTAPSQAESLTLQL